MKPIQMTEDALNYKNEWVAFSEDLQRVVGHGRSSKQASDMAREAGEEYALLFFVPQDWSGILVV